MTKALAVSPTDPIVPLWFRLSLICGGSAFLHYPEIGEFIGKRWKQQQQQQTKKDD
jgi:hypothetical protein